MGKLDQLLEDLAYLINWLADERGGGQEHVEVAENPQVFMEQWDRFRAMVNTRKPGSASPEFLRVQDRVLKMMVAEKGLVRARDLPRLAGDERLSIWRGDICALECDAVVNAANSALLGCWIPGHDCIDNAIHTFAGVQLRLECARIMQKQGYEEPIGQAKVTSAYNLPAKHVIHTVGPLCKQAPTTEQRGQLADCYISCLDAAANGGLPRWRSAAYRPARSAFRKRKRRASRRRRFAPGSTRVGTPERREPTCTSSSTCSPPTTSTATAICSGKTPRARTATRPPNRDEAPYPSTASAIAAAKNATETAIAA